MHAGVIKEEIPLIYAKVDKKTREGLNGADALKLLKWNDEALNGEGFKPWKEFDHPQLGKVEIGGWKTKFTWS